MSESAKERHQQIECERIGCDVCRTEERGDNHSLNQRENPIVGIYFVRTTPVSTKSGCWNYLRCEVFRRLKDGGEEKVGEYTRKYGTFYDTFEPFVKERKEYALVSDDYTSSTVISLEDCRVIARESLEPKSFGFCPTGFYVPFLGKDHPKNGHFGIVCGCVWGDDNSWKIEYLDLSRIEEGILTREARWGYVELPAGSNALKRCVRAYSIPISGEEKSSSWSGFEVAVLGWQNRDFSNESAEVRELREEKTRLLAALDECTEKMRQLNEELKCKESK